MSSPAFAVALIAGGRSTRMGADKGRLRDADGLELWRGRLAVLRELGVEEVMISCRPDQTHFADSGARLVFDQWPDAGPLGGITSCLETMSAGRLVALGVDLPGMTAGVLRELMDASGPSQGAVFHNGRFFEPLAAVYSGAMGRSARERLEAGEFSLQPWLREAEAEGLIRSLPCAGRLEGCFRNFNSPGDFPFRAAKGGQ